MSELSVEDLIAEFVERSDRGEVLDPHEFAAQHPSVRHHLEHALEQLRQAESLFPTEPEVAQPRVVGEYRVLGELGRGGMGRVFEVEHTETRNVFALKLLSGPAWSNPRSMTRLKREGDILRRIDHDGIVRIVDVGSESGAPFLVMERVAGDSLATRLEVARSRRLAQPTLTDAEWLELPGGGVAAHRAALLVASLARAVAAAHASGLLHRDIKPANVLLRDDGRPVLIDFGLAADASAPTLTRTGDVLGTPHYMAPEQAAGRTATARTDVYGLGAVLFELLTLQPPHPGQDPLAVLDAVRRRPVKIPSFAARALPRDFRIVLHRALAFDPRDRYPSADAFADDLESFAKARKVAAKAPGLAERGRQVWRFQRLWIAAAIAVILVVALALLALRESDETRADRVRNAAAEAADDWVSRDRAQFATSLATLRDLAPMEPAVAALAVLQRRDRNAKEPDQTADPMVIGAHHIVRRDYRAALAPLERAVAVRPDDAVTALLLGHAARRAKQMDRAHEMLAAAAHLIPQGEAIRLEQYRAYRDSGRWPDAERALLEAQNLGDDSPATWRLLAETRIQLKTFDKALAAIEQALSRLPKPPPHDFIITYSTALTEVERFDEAQAPLREIIAAEPGNEKIRYRLAFSLDRAHRLRETLEQYEAILATRPRSSQIRLAIAWLITGSNRDKCAECAVYFTENPQLLDFERAETLSLEALESDRGLRPGFLESFVPIAMRLKGRSACRDLVGRCLEEAHEEHDDGRILRLSKAHRTLR